MSWRTDRQIDRRVYFILPREWECPSRFTSKTTTKNSSEDFNFSFDEQLRGENQANYNSHGASQEFIRMWWQQKRRLRWSLWDDGLAFVSTTGAALRSDSEGSCSKSQLPWLWDKDQIITVKASFTGRPDQYRNRAALLEKAQHAALKGISGFEKVLMKVHVFLVGLTLVRHQPDSIVSMRKL